MDGRQRLHPAFDAGQRGAQLMADRGDELVFHLLGFTQVFRHLVDCPAHAPDLIIVTRFGQAGFQFAAGDAVGRGFHLGQRPHNRPHKKQTAPQRKSQHRHHHPGRQQHKIAPLAVGQRQAGDQPHGGDTAGRVGHQRCHRHNPLAIRRAENRPAHAGGAVEGAVKICAVCQVLVDGAAGRAQHKAGVVEQHELKLILFVKLFHGAAQRLAAGSRSIAGVTGSAGGLQPADKGGKAAFHRLFHPAVQALVTEIQEQGFGQSQDQHAEQQTAPQPSVGNALDRPTPSFVTKSICLRQVHSACKTMPYGFQRYPYPHTVRMWVGLLGSSSIFMRRRRMLTSTILTSP